MTDRSLTPRWVYALDLEWAEKVRYSVRLPSALTRLADVVYLDELQENGVATQSLAAGALIVVERRRLSRGRVKAISPRYPDPADPSYLWALRFAAEALHAKNSGWTSGSVTHLRHAEAHLRAMWRLSQ